MPERDTQIIPSETEYYVGIAVVVLGAILADYLLEWLRLNYGRWHCFKMFAASLLLACMAYVIQRRGGTRLFWTWIFSGLFFIFGITILVNG